MTHTARHPALQAGFTLIELMIAMVISLALVGGAFGIMVSSNNTKEKTQANTELLGSARLIAGSIGQDIRQAGMFGRLRGARSIEGIPGASNELAAVPGDCDTQFYSDLEQYIFATNNSNPWAATCIGGDYVDDTDILVVKYTELQDLPHADWSSLPEESVYLFSNPSGGRLVWEGTNPPDTADFTTGFAPEAVRMFNPLRVYIYYLSEPTDTTLDIDQTSLVRVGLSPGSDLYEKEVIATGVDDFQVMLGIEDCDDIVTLCTGRVTEFRTADAIDWTDPTTVGRIRAVRVLTVSGHESDIRASVSMRDYTFGSDAISVEANRRVWQGTYQVRNSL